MLTEVVAVCENVTTFNKEVSKITWMTMPEHRAVGRAVRDALIAVGGDFRAGPAPPSPVEREASKLLVRAGVFTEPRNH